MKHEQGNSQQDNASAKCQGDVAVRESGDNVAEKAARRYQTGVRHLGGHMLDMVTARSGRRQDGGIRDR